MLLLIKLKIMKEIKTNFEDLPEQEFVVDQRIGGQRLSIGREGGSMDWTPMSHYRLQ